LKNEVVGEGRGLVKKVFLFMEKRLGGGREGVTEKKKKGRGKKCGSSRRKKKGKWQGGKEKH